MVEALVDAGLAVDLPTLRIAFDDRSEFRVPRLNNFMRFAGKVEMALLSAPDEAALAGLERALHATWPDLLAGVDIPVGDRLTSTRNQIGLRLHALRLEVSFDLEAD